MNNNRGALIEISKDFSNLNCYNNKFGLSSNSRIRARSVVEDNEGNIWTLNAFSEQEEGEYNIASVLLNNKQWQSVKMDIPNYDLPTDIAFDSYNRPWIGFQRNGESW